MPAINLFTAPGQKDVDPERQRAVLVAWLLVCSNSLLCQKPTRLVCSDDELATVIEQGKQRTINFIDLREVYPFLQPLDPAEVDEIFNLARENDEFHAVASDFWATGESLLRYMDHYCLAVSDVLKMNRH